MIKTRRQRFQFKKNKTRISRKFSTNTMSIAKFLIAIVLLGMIGFGLVRLKYMFVDSEYFMIKEVVVKVSDEDGSVKELSLNKKVIHFDSAFGFVTKCCPTKSL